MSLGGDSDTLACITGGIAEAFYGMVPAPFADEIYERIPAEWRDLLTKFVSKSHYKCRTALID